MYNLVKSHTHPTTRLQYAQKRSLTLIIAIYILQIKNCSAGGLILCHNWEMAKIRLGTIDLESIYKKGLT